MRRFVLMVEGTDYQIEVVKDAVTVSGRPFHVKVADQKVTVDGIEYSVELDQNIVWVNGFSYRFELRGRPMLAGPLRRSQSLWPSQQEVVQGVDPRPTPPLVVSGGYAVEAVMPGKVSRVLVKEGDAIHAGDVVCILEAMKMENELHAHQAGTVQRVLVRAGQDVEAGEPLVIIV